MRGGGKRIRAILVATLKNDPPPRQRSASGGWVQIQEGVNYPPPPPYQGWKPLCSCGACA